MKLFECIVDDGKQVFKETVAVKNRKQLIEQYGGNGTFIKIKDVTKEYPIDLSHLLGVINNKFGDTEIKLLLSLIEEHMKKECVSL